jgi:VIT1/CCC1 family predicted Fe2+/Mn2+ transporter
MTQLIDPNTTHTVSELIQLSVAPVFLLAAVAGLLNVFTGRLTRIMDQVYKLDSMEKSEEITPKLISRRKFLTMRMSNINKAILFCTTTGLLVALVILTMFLSTLLNFSTSLVISLLFILAMLSLIGALYVFLKEIHYTTSFIRMQRDLNETIE